MTSADIESAGQHIYARLERELSPHLLYHSLYHTRDDVVPAAIRLATAAGLGQEEWLILVTAAMYHDAGFLLTYAQHEQGSIHIAREALPTFGYSPEQVANVIDVIAATRMPQKPNGFLQELICDADLNMLGRDDFMQLNRLLLQETRHFSNQPSPKAIGITNRRSSWKATTFSPGSPMNFSVPGKRGTLAGCDPHWHHSTDQRRK